MPSQYVPPMFDATSFSCPRCGAHTGQEWESLYRLDDTENVSFEISDGQALDWPRQGAGAGFPGMIDYTWSASKCYSCSKYSLWIGKSLAFPIPNEADLAELELAAPNEDLPPLVLELYSEAMAVLPHSKRAAAALCRAALEQLAKHLTPDLPPELKLDGRLIVLGRHVSSPTLKALNIVRHTGNTALHGEKDGDLSAVIYLDETDATIATVFFMSINALADELITKPRVMEELYGQLPDGVRTSFEAKQKKDRGD